MNPMHDWQPPQDDPSRVSSSEHVNARIDRETRGALTEIGDDPGAIRARLAELDREWHLDRALIASFAVLGSLTAWGAMRSLRREGRLGAVGALFWTQLGFLLYHSIRGWCPPVAVLRRFGYRTAREISAERVTLEKRLLILGAQPTDAQG